jgi:hypothetical protein
MNALLCLHCFYYYLSLWKLNGLICFIPSLMSVLVSGNKRISIGLAFLSLSAAQCFAFVVVVVV